MGRSEARAMTAQPAAQGLDYQIALVRALHPPVRRARQVDRVLEGAA